MNGSMTMLLVLLSLGELAVMVWLWRGWARRENDCADCQADLKVARAHLAATVALVREIGMEEGVCCCGDDMEKHSSPMDCGHTPVDAGVYHRAPTLEAAENSLTGLYPEYLHPRRGTSYRVLMSGVRFNCSGKLRDGDPVVVYQDLDSGKLSCRGEVEFHDGRFVSLTPPGRDSYPGSKGS